MNGDVEDEAPRPRPLSAGIWTLFSWLRRTDRSSSSESITSAGSDRTVASFDFLGPLNYKNANTPIVLPQGPLTDTYKKRLSERNLRRQHDRDLTLRSKYGLFREEGLGYEAFSLPSVSKLQKDNIRKDRERRATSESIQRRSAYVPGKRRAPLPPTVVISTSLPRTNKRKRPAPKPPLIISEENKENLVKNKIIQMNPTSEVGKHSFLTNDKVSESKSDKSLKLKTKEVKLRTDKGFLKNIFENKKRYSAIDMSHIKLLPSISELDKQAAEIVEANKLLRRSSGSNSNYTDYQHDSASNSSSDDMWACTTCLRKYKSVVKCCIYCVIKENSCNNKNVQSVATNTSNICTQKDDKNFKETRVCEMDEKKKLRKMLKEMKDSLPKRPKHNEKCYADNKDESVKNSIETPTLRIGSTIDNNIKFNCNNTKSSGNQNECSAEGSLKTARNTFLLSQPSSSKQSSINVCVPVTSCKPYLDPTSDNIFNTVNLNSSQNVMSSRGLTSHVHHKESVKEIVDNSKESLLIKKVEQDKHFVRSDGIVNKKIDKTLDLENSNDLTPTTAKYTHKIANKIVDKKTSNVQTNRHITSNNLMLEPNKENALHIASNNSNNNDDKVIEHTEESVNIKITKNINKQSIQKNEDNATGIHSNIECINLGNVFSPDAVNVDKIEKNLNLSHNSNIDLNAPLKISSLLNPLYCPKYKISNEKVTDCNFGRVLETQDTSKIYNKNGEKTSKMQVNLPITTVAPSVYVQTASTSSAKLSHIDLQKSEASTNESTPSPSKVLNNKAEQNSCVMGPHDRRRNLINQLEQAIAKGDEELAAEAAAKLAKLKLSCSVLSFSSQIVAAAVPNNGKLSNNNKKHTEDIKDKFYSNRNIATNVRQFDLSAEIHNVLDDKIVENRFDNKKSTNKLITRKEIENNMPQASTSTYNQITNDEIIEIEIWVEDKKAARGPIPLRISRKGSIGQLKRQVEISLGLEISLQRWIIGRTLCIDDNTLLVSLAGQDFDAPFYLCLVESDTKKDNTLQIKDPKAGSDLQLGEINGAPGSDVYKELVELEQQSLVPNSEEFECAVCTEQCVIGAGVILRECIHTFCKECLADVIRHCEEPVVACPAIECLGTLQEREIRALLSTEEHERWLARGLAAAESGTRNTFHCRTRDCKGWAFCEPAVRKFPCPVCKHTNCIPCQAVHEGETCEQYQLKLRMAVSAAESNQSDEGTQALLKSLISRGEAIECPECNAVITKKWGCDWVKCTACKTEICWITKGRRWGPGGKGDTSGGCRCGIDGKRCHPSCGYCH